MRFLCDCDRIFLRSTALTLEVSFNEAYKEWRNRARKYKPESVVRAAIELLREPTKNHLEEIRRAPWQVLLLVKWVCQDKFSDHHAGEHIASDAFYELRQKLWEFPNKISVGTRDTLPVQLFFRRLINPQIGFQRPSSPGFVREAALLAQQRPDHPLRRLFEKKVGIGILDFLDLTFATYAAVLEGKRLFDLRWFEPLQATFPDPVIQTFVSSISRTFPELIAFCRSLPDSKFKVASEFYESPAVSRYPFLRTGDTIECWHPAVFYRGMESFVHSVLSEEGQDYMDRFSKLFERHVIGEAQKLGVLFLNEDALRMCVTDETKVPDGLLSFPDCNVFIESKAGLFDESLMTVGHSKIFGHKTKALRTAIAQAWATSVSLRKERRAPPNVVNAERDYLLIVTNKELSASRGPDLVSMYLPGTLTYPNSESGQLLPLDHIYVLSVDDFERLMAGALEFDLPLFLRECVEADRRPETSVHFFEQHLNKRKVPRQFSKLVATAIDDASSRLTRAFS